MDNSTKRRLDEIRSFINESENHWKTKDQKDQVLQYVADLAYLCQPSKTNKLEASVNCLVHHLVEKSLQEQQKKNEYVSLLKNKVYDFFEKNIEPKKWIVFWDFYEAYKIQKGRFVTDFLFKNYLVSYCSENNKALTLQKRKLNPKNEAPRVVLQLYVD